MVKLILHYLKRYKLLLAINICSVFGFALAELGIPTIVSEMIDNGVMTGDTGYLLKMGGVIAVISILGVCGTIILGYCCARISTLVTRDIRNDVFIRVQSLSHHEMNQFGVSSLITRTNNDAFQILQFLNIILRTLYPDHPGLPPALPDYRFHRAHYYTGRHYRGKNFRSHQ